VDEAAAAAGLDIPATRALMDELVEANIAAERAGGRIWRHHLLRHPPSRAVRHLRLAAGAGAGTLSRPARSVAGIPHRAQGGAGSGPATSSIPACAAMHLGIARAESYPGRLASAAHETRSGLRALTAWPDADPLFVSELHRELCWILDRQGDLRGALREARRALGLHPGDSRTIGRAFAVNAVGFCEARLELCDKALAHCTAAAQLLEHTTHRHGQAAVWDSLGFIYARTGNLRQAARSYERDRPVPLGRITFRGSGPLFPDAWPSRTAGRHGSKFRAGRGAGAGGRNPGAFG
jgi:hypothetical protein